MFGPNPMAAPRFKQKVTVIFMIYLLGEQIFTPALKNIAALRLG